MVAETNDRSSSFSLTCVMPEEANEAPKSKKAGDAESLLRPKNVRCVSLWIEGRPPCSAGLNGRGLLLYSSQAPSEPSPLNGVACLISGMQALICCCVGMLNRVGLSEVQPARVECCLRNFGCFDFRSCLPRKRVKTFCSQLVRGDGCVDWQLDLCEVLSGSGFTGELVPWFSLPTRLPLLVLP